MPHIKFTRLKENECEAAAKKEEIEYKKDWDNYDYPAGCYEVQSYIRLLNSIHAQVQVRNVRKYTTLKYLHDASVKHKVRLHFLF